jgi:hypothetical protein
MQTQTTIKSLGIIGTRKNKDIYIPKTNNKTIIKFPVYTAVY